MHQIDAEARIDDVGELKDRGFLAVCHHQYVALAELRGFVEDE